MSMAYNKRMFLSSISSTDSTAFIQATAESSYNGTDPLANYVLIISDCNRWIMLEFVLSSAYMRKRNLAKLDCTLVALITNQALGVVRFKDIEALDAHPGVLWMAAGQAPQARLDTAVKDIKARASSLDSGGVPVGGLWHAVESNGDFKNLPDATGKDVFVGIIDTGIDYKHPMFMSDMGPPKKKSRIFRIWDQGLTPAVVAEGPDKKYLVSPNTYGVEYKQVEIESALNGGAAINHKDCIGHGTHVAGIAAGGTKFHKPGGDAKFVGVAPEASIIAVKLLDVPDSIRYKLETGFGDEVGSLTRLTDAVVYCFEIAKEANKPVVINMSFGDSSKPGDGLDETASFFDFMMDPSRPAGGLLAYPKGNVLVMAAGNEGDQKIGKRPRSLYRPQATYRI